MSQIPSDRRRVKTINKRKRHHHVSTLKFYTLESKYLLASVTVSNATDLINAPDVTTISALLADDGGDGISLREAITAANNNSDADVITFDSPIFAGPRTISLGSQLPTITENLTINGPGQDLLILDAGLGGDGLMNGNGYRIFNIDNGTSNIREVAISGLTLTGGDVDGGFRNGHGGAIFNSENLNLSNITISGNSADVGGGIHNNGGDITVTGSTISDNLAREEGGGFRNTNGTLTVTDSKIGDNSASSGGGIYGSSDLTVTSSTIIGNSATSAGGGIFNTGNISVTSTTISGNSARNGGGIVNDIFNSRSATVTSSTISENSASSRGGAIFNSGSGTLNVISNTLSGNSAGSSGGGIYNDDRATVMVAGSTISGNSARNGGGIFNVDGATADVVSTIVANSPSGGDVYGSLEGRSNLIEDGTGGLFSSLTGSPLLGPLAFNGGPTQTHALLSGSPAINAGSSSKSLDQRGLSRLQLGQVDIGAYELQRVAPVEGLVVSTTDDALDDYFSIGQLSLREAIAIANDLAGANTITFSSSFNTQQSIELGSQLPTITDDLTIIGPGQGLLTLDAGLGGDGLMNGNGYRIFRIDSGDVAISGLTLTGGDVADRGGAILNRRNLNLSNSTISGNSGGFRGGGIDNDTADTVTITNSTISGNSATLGGGIYNDNRAVATINSSTISGNSASDRGGGIFNEDTASATVTSSTISGNSASLGGGIFNDASASATINNTIVANSPSGGDVYGLGTFVGNFNLIEDGTGGLTDTITGDPLLGPLAVNGGHTKTHALLLGSPALDAGDSQASEDQRGARFRRNDGNGVDIGAFERQSLNLVVDTLSDENDGDYFEGALSLREAIELANANMGVDTITFAPTVFVGQSTVSLGSQLPTITDDLFINGPGQNLLTLDAGLGGDGLMNGNGDRIFNIDDGSFSTTLEVSISGLTLVGGDFEGEGGAIFNHENLHLSNSTFRGNSASRGGGIFNNFFATTTITGSTIHGNSASFGGGIFNTSTGNIDVTATTISGNSAGFRGGGIFNSDTSTANIAGSTISGNLATFHGGGIFNRGTSTVASTTISDNSASSGGGIYNDVFAIATVTNSILANSGSGGDVLGQLFGSFSLIEDGTGGLADTVTGDPLLGPLAFNGGPTQTHALLPGSVAIDAGNTTEAFDQRRLLRVVDLPGVANVASSNGADIGAFERQVTEPISNPPVVSSFVRDEGGVLELPDLLSTISVVFDVDVSISSDALEIRNDTLGGSAVDVSNLIFDYDTLTQTATWDFRNLTLDSAFYTFQLSDDIVSVVGNLRLDGDEDGDPGVGFVESIYVALPGDANLDGQVNVLGDGFALVSNLGITGGATWAQGDFNDDGNVNVLGDAFLLISSLGQDVRPSVTTTQSPAAVSIPVALRLEPFSNSDDRDDSASEGNRSSPPPESTHLLLAGAHELRDEVFGNDF